ncbi:MAG: hypothetical protein GC160_10090 [Acidobacteria bacterium]|nr:hypothetical protein [Acidobacteriota bacterium]
MLLAVGGHSRNIGKTSLACSILSATRELGWTAVKISQYGHGVCTQDGKPCDCQPQEPLHRWAIGQESNPDGPEDTQRMLAAGAKRVLWARAPQGALGPAAEALRQRLRGAEHVLLESNSALDFFEPDLYLSVLDFRVEDFKASARRHLARADAFALTAPDAEPWPWFDRSLLTGRSYVVAPPSYCSEELMGLVQGKLEARRTGMSVSTRS